MIFHRLNYKNEYFFRPSSLALNGNYIYAICNSKNSYIYKINKKNFKSKDVLKTDRNFSKIISVSNDRLLLHDKHNNCLYLIDQNFSILNSLNYEKNLLFSFATKSIKLNGILLAGTFNNIDLLIREIYIENDEFVFKSNYEIPQISKVEGILDSIKHRFIISDIDKSRVISFNKVNHQFKDICTFGRFGKSKVRKPGEIIFHYGKILLCDRHNYLIQIFDADGQYISQIGGKGRNEQEFDLPSSLVSLDQNNFLIADMNNDRLVNVNYDGFNRNIVFKRDFKESLLARPVSMTQLNKKLFVADRDNDIVQVFDKDLNQINLITDKFLKRPTAVSRIIHEGSMYIALLTRGDQNKDIYLSLYNELGEKKIRLNFSFLNDPQGMISIFNKSLCISDTLNRRGLLIGQNLEVIKNINLSEFAEDKRYLCRVPSLIKDRIFFPDYHTGITIVTDIYLNYIKKIRINLNYLNLLNIRKIFKIKNYFLILGKSNENNSPCILVEDIFSEKKGYQINYDFHTPVDYIYFGKKHLLLDKESDAIKEIDINPFKKI